MTDPTRPQAKQHPEPSVADQIAAQLSALSPSERKVARALLADYPACGLGTTASLAARSSVSAPTVIRFCRALGYDSFGAFQQALRGELSNNNAAPLARIPWHTSAGTPAETLYRRGEWLTENALESIARLPSAEIDAAVALLADATKTVYVAGGRFTRAVAQHLTTNLEQLRPRVELLDDPFGADAARVLDMNGKYVLTAFDFRRYQLSTVRLAQTAKEHGASVLLVTDERLSPAAAYADVVLPISTAAPAPFYSLVSGTLLVELLLVPVLDTLGSTFDERLARWDALRSAEFVPGSKAPTDVTS